MGMFDLPKLRQNAWRVSHCVQRAGARLPHEHPTEPSPEPALPPTRHPGEEAPEPQPS